ncbi:MAG TPA: DUF6428 family protein [Devosiaceae bacterium]|nr:DUF6428 family protein [Devosiaceae bacterium]
MTAHASPLLPGDANSSLAAVLAALAPHDEKALVIEYAGRTIQPGYHVTEVKAGSFVTLDCGGNPDAWQETILQVEDLPAGEDEVFMKVGKFRGILAQVDRKIRLNNDARLTFEVSAPGEPMQVFDVAEVVAGTDTATIRLNARPAICKPRHRVEQANTSASCAPSTGAAKSGACCA